MSPQLPGGAVRQGHARWRCARNPTARITLTFEAGGATVRRGRRPSSCWRCRSACCATSTSRALRALSAAKLRVDRHAGDGHEREDPRRGRRARHGRGSATAAPPTANGSSFGLRWDDSVPLGPDACPALLLGFPGAARAARGSPARRTVRRRARDANWFLDAIEPLFPGTTAPRSPAAPTRTTGRSTRGSRAPTPTTRSARPPATARSPQPTEGRVVVRRRAHLDRQPGIPRRRRRDRRARRAPHPRARLSASGCRAQA